MNQSVRFLAAWLVIFQFTLCAQAPPPVPQQQPAGTPAPQEARPIADPSDRLRPTYVLRPGDQILIRAFEMEEIGDRPYRIDGDGYISLPQLGRIKAGGVTVEALEAALIESLKKFV